MNVNYSDEDVSTLAELGLTATQAKVYLSLAKAKKENFL
jgi:sugar-specific transcriptional regulator TrmB